MAKYAIPKNLGKVRVAMGVGWWLDHRHSVEIRSLWNAVGA
jgi:hypothetical protein